MRGNGFTSRIAPSDMSRMQHHHLHVGFMEKSDLHVATYANRVSRGNPLLSRYVTHVVCNAVSANPGRMSRWEKGVANMSILRTNKKKKKAVAF